MKPDFLKPKIDTIPAELKQRDQWVCWKGAERDGKLTKVPHDSKTHRKASSTNPKTWAPFWQALTESKSNGYHGVGIVVTKDDDFCIWDFDHCVENDRISTEVLEMIAKLNSYTEYSPSGKGIRVITKGRLPKTGRKKGNFEVYDTGRYFTITGHPVNNSPDTIESRQAEITAVHREIFGPQKKRNKDSICTKNGTDRPPNDEIQPVLEKAFHSRNGNKIKALFEGDYSDYPSQSGADLALCCHLSFFSKNNPEVIDAAFRESGLYRPKWDSKRGDSTYGGQTIEKAIEATEERAAIQAEPMTSRQGDPQGGQADCEIAEPDVLEFPPAVMKGVAGKFSQLYANHLEAPAHFFFVSFLSCLGAVIGNRLTLATEIAPQPRLYTLLLGSSADVRKSTVIKKVVSFFKQTLDVFSVCWGVGSAEGLQRKLVESNSLLLCLDEFKQFVGKCRIEASVLLPFVNTLFESNSYESWTKKTEIVLDDVYLSLLAASTIATYERTWDSSFTDIGFNNRLFIVPGDSERKFSFPKKLPIPEVEELKAQVGKLLHHASYQAELDLTEEAKQIFQDWYLELDGSIHAKRLDQYALRFMALLAVNQFKKEVDAEVVNDAITIMGWQLEARQLHDPIDADSAIAAMEERIRRVLKRKPRTERELQQYSNAKRAGLRVYQWAKENLTKSKEIRWDKALKKYIGCDGV